MLFELSETLMRYNYRMICVKTPKHLSHLWLSRRLIIFLLASKHVLALRAVTNLSIVSNKYLNLLSQTTLLLLIFFNLNFYFILIIENLQSRLHKLQSDLFCIRKTVSLFEIKRFRDIYVSRRDARWSDAESQLSNATRFLVGVGVA